MIVDVVIYVDGLRNASCPLDGVYRSCHDQGGFAWVGLYEPTEEEFVSATGEFDLHKLAVEDAIHAHQRPKVERYGDSVFVVLKSARYLEGSRTVEFGEIQAFVRPDFIVTVRHGEASSLHIARRLIENDPDLLRRGPAAVLYVIMDHVVDDYASVIDSLERDIDEIETEVFGGTLGVSRRIYEISREVIQFHRAARPLAAALERLMKGDLYDVESEVRAHLCDVEDHVLRATEQIEAFRELLFNIIVVNHPSERESERGVQKPHPCEHRTERTGKEDQRLGGYPSRPNHLHGYLRHELYVHAGVDAEGRLPALAGADRTDHNSALSKPQTCWVAVANGRRISGPAAGSEKEVIS